MIAILLASAPAFADPAATATTASQPSLGDEIGDQGIGVEAGLATGGRVTPGGLRITGHYLYQLADRDWFDGGASFTFGGGSAQCFRDRMDQFLCTHGIADGQGFEVSATVRHYFAAQGQFLPFARAGIGVGLARFPSDGVSGLIIPLHAGGGVRVAVSDSVAVTGQGELAVGFGAFNHSLGAEPQLGLTVVAGAEFRLR